MILRLPWDPSVQGHILIPQGGQIPVDQPFPQGPAAVDMGQSIGVRQVDPAFPILCQVA